MFDFIIKPAVEECGYSAERSDKLDKPGIITSQVIQHIINDPLVIADLTEHNPNVFYELAIRHAIRKPLVQIIQDGYKIPFDITTLRTIFVDHNDLRKAEEAKDKIIGQVKAVEADTTAVDTPISQALTLQFLEGSSDPIQKTLADILSGITDVQAQLTSMSTAERSGAIPPFILDGLEKRLNAASTILIRCGGDIEKGDLNSVGSAIEGAKKSLDYAIQWCDLAKTAPPAPARSISTHSVSLRELRELLTGSSFGKAKTENDTTWVE